MGLYITGDTHGQFDRFSDIEFLCNIDDYKNSTPDKNAIAIAGDFGGVFECDDKSHEWLKTNEGLELDKLQDLPFTFVFVDGNHENFPRLTKEFPDVRKFGGVTGQIRDNIFWLKQRGHIYDIQGYKVLAFGGATSYDRYLRRENISWWPQEHPTNEDYMRCQNEIIEHNMTVDLVLTHNAPLEALHFLKEDRMNRFMFDNAYDGLSDPLPAFFQFIAERLLFRRWFFGHMHKDWPFNIRSPHGYRQYRAVYKSCIEVEHEEYHELRSKLRV